MPEFQHPITRYGDFFLFYLQEHAKPVTRAFHYVACAASLATIVYAVFVGPLWILALALFTGYGPAWVSHAFIEKNRPATFTYPLWSLISDYYMTWLWATGGLNAKLAEAGVSDGAVEAAE